MQSRQVVTVGEASLSEARLLRGDTLSNQVTEALRHSIMSGELEIGGTLPAEAVLARELDVSRTVVREAVSRLKAEGFLVARQGRGAIVLRNRPHRGFAIPESDVENPNRLSQILELRLGLEVEAAAIAAQRASPEALDALQAAIAAFQSARGSVSADAGLCADADLRFHRTICEATGNGYYLDLFSYLSASLKLAMEAGLRIVIAGEDDRPEAPDEHEAIAYAIANGNSELARLEMREHLLRSNRRMLSRSTVLGGEGA